MNKLKFIYKATISPIIKKFIDNGDELSAWQCINGRYNDKDLLRIIYVSNEELYELSKGIGKTWYDNGELWEEYGVNKYGNIDGSYIKYLNDGTTIHRKYDNGIKIRDKEIFIGYRYSNKTERYFKMLMDNPNNVLIVSKHQDKSFLINKYGLYNTEISRNILTAYDFVKYHGIGYSYINDIIIDDYFLMDEKYDLYNRVMYSSYNNLTIISNIDNYQTYYKPFIELIRKGKKSDTSPHYLKEYFLNKFQIYAYHVDLHKIFEELYYNFITDEDVKIMNLGDEFENFEYELYTRINDSKTLLPINYKLGEEFFKKYKITEDDRIF